MNACGVATVGTVTTTARVSESSLCLLFMAGLPPYSSPHAYRRAGAVIDIDDCALGSLQTRSRWETIHVNRSAWPSGISLDVRDLPRAVRGWTDAVHATSSG